MVLYPGEIIVADALRDKVNCLNTRGVPKFVIAVVPDVVFAEMYQICNMTPLVGIHDLSDLQVHGYVISGFEFIHSSPSHISLAIA
jgi:hypothetical protein